jgi:hypothetical protein
VHRAVGLRRPIRECLAGHDASPAHPDDGRLGIVTKVLRYWFGAAQAAERPDGSGNGLPDLTRVGFIAALHRRCEQGVGFEGANAQVVYRLPHLSLWPAAAVPAASRRPACLSVTQDKPVRQHLR